MSKCSIKKIKDYRENIGGRYAVAWPTTCRVMYRMHIDFLLRKIFLLYCICPTVCFCVGLLIGHIITLFM